MSDIPVCPVTGRLCRQLCQFSCSWPLDYRNRQAQLGGTLAAEYSHSSNAGTKYPNRGSDFILAAWRF